MAQTVGQMFHFGHRLDPQSAGLCNRLADHALALDGSWYAGGVVYFGGTLSPRRCAACKITARLRSGGTFLSLSGQVFFFAGDEVDFFIANLRIFVGSNLQQRVDLVVARLVDDRLLSAIAS